MLTSSSSKVPPPPPSSQQLASLLTAKPHAFSGAILSPKHARELTPAVCLAIAVALAEQQLQQRKAAGQMGLMSVPSQTIPYTLWITEAWRVLGWAEPSAALFWEMATLYHTLYLAGRALAEQKAKRDVMTTPTSQQGNPIPPILSCGSASSVDTNSLEGSSSGHRLKKLAAASAKELPVWLVGTFLLLHCEERAYRRNLSAQDERRFYQNKTQPASEPVRPVNRSMNFTSLLEHPSLSPRTRLHAGWNQDNRHCSAYVLRHLRKILLLSAVSHNPEALRACMHLAALPPPTQQQTPPGSDTLSLEELRQQHDEEHGAVGLQVLLTPEDVERLNLVLQPVSGGDLDELPRPLSDYLLSPDWQYQQQQPLGQVEASIRQHLETELMRQKVMDPEDATVAALGRFSLHNNPALSEPKELTYHGLRGTTMMLKPNGPGPDPISDGASVNSGEQVASLGLQQSAGRLHDLIISECSDAHFYLLQPFEHATIAACTGCTIVVGAVAGLVHIVDCENTHVTTAARRILVSNSCDTFVAMFSPSPPLLVGDNRSCQFAPYNTYYEGLRDDLLATGLAAAVVSDHASPYRQQQQQQENSIAGGGSENAGAWPPLQCASNKWKQPVEVSKLEVPQGTPAPAVSPAGADDKLNSNDATMNQPVVVPATEFEVLFVPLESNYGRDNNESISDVGMSATESNYGKHLQEILHSSPFVLPMEYEKAVLTKAERMRTIQQAAIQHLQPEQQALLQQELNRGFRDWLVTSGNLRQVLDLVHLEQKELEQGVVN